MTEQQLQQQIDGISENLAKLMLNPPLQDHQHNGFDSTRVEYKDIAHRKLYVHHTIFGTQAATAGNYGVFYIVPVACVVTGFQEVHQTAGTDGSDVTLDLEKLIGTTAPDSGDSVLAAVLSLKATINSVQDGTMTSTLANRSLVAGNRLCMKDAGVLTSVANVTVKIELTIV